MVNWAPSVVPRLADVYCSVWIYKKLSAKGIKVLPSTGEFCTIDAQCELANWIYYMLEVDQLTGTTIVWANTKLQ